MILFAAGGGIDEEVRSEESHGPVPPALSRIQIGEGGGVAGWLVADRLRQFESSFLFVTALYHCSLSQPGPIR
jgi:hypothetical protein